jgi:four helix bundle protein
MPRQDLGARALRFSAEILTLNRRLLPKSERFGGALNQLVRSATGIGANVEEAQVANSRREMAAKYAIALREARETLYWLRLLSTDPLVGNIEPLIKEANEWVAMLTTTVKKLRS